ncbi:glycosyl transferase [Pedobacter quisquiliarum]|uniref:Glycosyl transferase n=1 Tax=Pedobacter quisquiliarum TaxID=1834438 RepID=A0A916UFA9_9SPHI|nr:glycosyltransferase family 2 protein [Pedobacter quisquiliarum]GGC69858.1 glycosyl transferase [Pedobacter quisquiliarum]
MKVSLITVVFNCEDYIEQCIQSVLAQDYGELEYIVIDGKSSDGTASIINRYTDRLSYYVSEPDSGMYDALNKGIAVATGELIGIVNADDYLVDTDVISAVADFLLQRNADAVYGNLNYVQRTKETVIKRSWRSNPPRRKDLRLGWMPAHPALFIKRSCFQRYGLYSLKLGTAADYELILRFFYKHHMHAVFLNKLIVHMRMGGMSNRNLRSLLNACANDYRAMVHNQLPAPVLALLCKKLRKLGQFI